MRRLFATGGIAVALLLSACATGGNGGVPQLERQDIIKEMKR